MSIAVQHRRGTATEHGTFTGTEGEITYDTTNKRIVAHDGSTVGGIPVAKVSEIASSILTTKGDLLTRDSDSQERLGVGANGMRLAADSSEPLGLKWVREIKAMAFYIDGSLATETNAISIIAPMGLTVTEIRIAVDTAPTGADLIIDVSKNGTTMYTTQANRPTITAGNTSATATDPDVNAIALGDKISIDIDQVGSTVAGENLSLIVICEVG